MQWHAFRLKTCDEKEYAAMKSWNEIRKDATKFAHRWKGAYDEKSQA